MENVSNSLTNASTEIKNKMTSVSFRDFLQSNTLVSKVAFTLLVMFIFFILLKFSVAFIPKILKNSESSRVFNGTIEGTNSLVIPQDPSLENAVTIKRSVNANKGVEFTWALWAFIDDDAVTNSDNNVHIFHKGDILKGEDGTNMHNIAAPGLYLKNGVNTLVVKMNTFDNQNNTYDITDIPLNKWVHIIIRVKNQRMDVYINGTIKRAIELGSVPKQNYGNIFVAQNVISAPSTPSSNTQSTSASLYGSKLSNLTYKDYALNISEIQKMVIQGPNRTLVSYNSMTDNTTNYLSFNWYTNN